MVQPPILAERHCTYVCVCVCVAISIHSLCEFLISPCFSFCAPHMSSLCLKCLTCVCVCAYVNAFKGVRQSWIRLSPWHLIHSCSLPCVLKRLWDVKPRLSFEAIHTLHSNNVLLPFARSLSPSFLTFLNLTSPHLWVQKPGFIQNSTFGKNSISPILFLLTIIPSPFPTVLLHTLNHDLFFSLPEKINRISSLKEKTNTDNLASTTGWWPWISSTVKERIYGNIQIYSIPRCFLIRRH